MKILKDRHKDQWPDPANEDFYDWLLQLGLSLYVCLSESDYVSQSSVIVVNKFLDSPILYRS